MATQETASSRRRSLFRPLWTCLGLLVVLGLGLVLLELLGFGVMRHCRERPSSRRPGPGQTPPPAAVRGRQSGGSRPGDEAAAQMGRGRRGEHREERPRLLRRGGQAGAGGKGPLACPSHASSRSAIIPSASTSASSPRTPRRAKRRSTSKGSAAAISSAIRRVGRASGWAHGNWTRGGRSPCADNFIRSWRWAFSI